MTIFARSYRPEKRLVSTGLAAPDSSIPNRSGMGMKGATEPMTLAEATEYLDWLEAHGRESSEIVVMSDGRVVVR